MGQTVWDRLSLWNKPPGTGRLYSYSGQGKTVWDRSSSWDKQSGTGHLCMWIMDLLAPWPWMIGEREISVTNYGKFTVYTSCGLSGAVKINLYKCTICFLELLMSSVKIEV